MDWDNKYIINITDGGMPSKVRPPDNRFANFGGRRCRLDIFKKAVHTKGFTLFKFWKK